MQLIPDLILAWALCQPIDGYKEHCWIGVKNFYAWNIHGYGVKVCVWGSGETHVGIGKWGKIVFQFKVFPGIGG
jgi:hypothetical protein